MKNSDCTFSYQTCIALAAISEGLSYVSFIWLNALLNRELNKLLPEIHRTLYEEVINYFLKVCNSLSLYFVIASVYDKLWH